MSKHTDRPAEYRRHAGGSKWHGNIVLLLGNDENGIRQVRTLTCHMNRADESETAANAARLVDCWNACLGIEDPAAAIDLARQALQHALGVFNAYRVGHEDREIVAAAVARLTPPESR